MKLKSIAWLNLSKNKKSQLKYCQIVPYTQKNSLLIKDILKTLLFSGINNYIKIRKTAFKELGKIAKDKIVLKSSSSVVFIEPCLLYKNIYKWCIKMMYKNLCKNIVKTNWTEIRNC